MKSEQKPIDKEIKMTTPRRIETMVKQGNGRQLVREMARYRSDLPEGMIDDLASNPVAFHAMALVRLVEMQQGHLPHARTLARQIAAVQCDDGSFGDVAVTALAARALLDSREPAVERAGIDAIDALAATQLDDGSFPAEPWPGSPASGLATAFVLVQLARQPHARARLNLESAASWLRSRIMTMPEPDRSLTRIALARCAAHVAGQARRLLELAA
jgi:hypothetical protein